MKPIKYIRTDDDYEIQDKRVDTILKKRIIMIGDSYGTGRDSEGNQTIPYMTTLPQKLGSHFECHTSAWDGAGFYNGLFTQQLREINVDNPETISIIYVIGGYNDRNITETDIAVKIDEFIRVANVLYPNAIVKLIDVATDMRYSERVSLNQVHTAYSWQSCVLGYNILHYKGFMQKDQYHPNQAGQTALTSGLYSIITSGDYTCYRHEFGNNIYVNSDVANSVYIEGSTIVYHIGNYISVYLPKLSYKLKSATYRTNVPIHLGYVDSNILLGLGASNLGTMRCTAWINTGENKQINATIDLEQDTSASNSRVKIMMTLNENGDAVQEYQTVNALVVPPLHGMYNSMNM